MCASPPQPALSVSSIIIYHLSSSTILRLSTHLAISATVLSLMDTVKMTRNRYNGKFLFLSLPLFLSSCLSPPPLSHSLSFSLPSLNTHALSLSLSLSIPLCLHYRSLSFSLSPTPSLSHTRLSLSLNITVSLSLSLSPVRSPSPRGEYAMLVTPRSFAVFRRPLSRG